MGGLADAAVGAIDNVSAPAGLGPSPSPVPVDHDPFNGSGPQFVPVDHDPFAISNPMGEAYPPQGGDAVRKTAAHFGQGLADWVGAPGRAASEGLTPEEAANWAASTALAMVGASRLPGGATRGSLGIAGGKMADHGPLALESKSARIYDAPDKPARQFSADYSRGAQADATGRLLTDIEGRPLVADRVVGRRILGGADEALTAAELAAAGEKIVGRPPASVPASALPRNTVGSYRDYRGPDGPHRRIDILNDLEPRTKAQVTAHEFGHAIDDLAGLIPTQGLNAELRQVYNTLNTGQERARNLTGPQHFGYSQANVPREMVAEAIRAYLTNPNYLKTVAPKTAAAIREAVNNNPRINRAIQFNTVLGSMAAGSALRSNHDPSGR
jgi:hypothetical protein